MKRWASSEPTVLCLLNSSFTYWSPRALRSGGRARCNSKMRRYKARTRETCRAGIAPREDRTPSLRKRTKRAHRTKKPGISKPEHGRKGARDFHPVWSALKSGPSGNRAAVADAEMGGFLPGGGVALVEMSLQCGPAAKAQHVQAREAASQRSGVGLLSPAQ